MSHRQLLLPLDLETHLKPEEFYVDDSNVDAFTWVQAWDTWALSGLVIHGPRGSGKTHLGAIFRYQSGAAQLSLDAPLHATPARVAEDNPCILIDDADLFVQSADGAPLFLLQLYNLIRERGGSLLLLAQTPPARWPRTVPDLDSRLRALPAFSIHAPGDVLLRQILLKLFSDFQVTVPENVMTYLLHHMERSFAGAQRIATGLNERSLREKRPITIDLCRHLLEGDDFDA